MVEVVASEEDAAALAAEAAEAEAVSSFGEQYTNELFCLGYAQGPPQSVVVVAEVSHSCEGQIIGFIPKDGNVPLLARTVYNA